MDYIPKHQSYIIPNPYNIPVHDQGNKNSCTSHGFALMLEYQLSNKFKERTLIDVNDLWKKQKKYGTATENGDYIEGPFIIAEKYGVKFKTDSGKKGIFFLNGKIIWSKNAKYD
ncbi:MAG: hypothetical protein Q7K65_01055 [Candidatus Buchananbacteria bacterium]|nr:hypothetical protein [Candidatus Buchananbacteria bacterium]